MGYLVDSDGECDPCPTGSTICERDDEDNIEFGDDSSCASLGYVEIEGPLCLKCPANCDSCDLDFGSSGYKSNELQCKQCSIGNAAIPTDESSSGACYRKYSGVL